jgi:glycosyltransferase involved in cell wall biosynthesis
MIQSPSVSVVIATYNYGHYLAGAIDSVLAQTYQDFEVIVVDDGSTDDTPDVVRPYLYDPRVHYVRTENRGQPAAQNMAIRLARAPWIAFLDADDQWLPTKLEKQIDLASRVPEVGVVYTRRLEIDAEGYLLESRQPTLYKGRVLAQMFLTNFVCFSSSMVRRDVLDRVGLFDESRRHAPDYDLWLRAARFYQFDFVGEPLVKYRVGHATLRRRHPELQLEGALARMRDFLELHGGRDFLDRELIRRGFAETYAHYGLILRDRSRIEALAKYLLAIAYQPGNYRIWMGLGSVFLPETARRLARRSLERPAEWPQVRRIASTGSSSNAAN